MKQYYKRKITYHHITSVLNHYGLSYEISKQLSNSQNAIYLVNGKYVMKFVLYDYRQEKDIYAQYAYETYLSQYVPIPKTYLTQDQKPFVCLKIQDVSFIVILQAYVKGRHVYKKDDTFNEVFIEKLGATIGKIHKASQLYQDPYQRFHFDQDRSIKNISFLSTLLGDEAEKRYLNSLKQVHRIPKKEHLYHVTHYDLHHLNVLQKHEQLYVLDFDDMTVGYIYMDIITAFDAVLDIYSYQHKHYIIKAVAFLKPLLKGYQSVYDNLNELPKYFHTLLIYRMFVLIIFIGNEFEHTPSIIKEIKAIYQETFMPVSVIESIFEQLKI